MKTIKENPKPQTVTYKDQVYVVDDVFFARDLEGWIEYTVYKTTRTKTKMFFAWYPIWVNHKFRWLKTVTVQYTFYVNSTSQMNLYDEWVETQNSMWKKTQIID